MKVCSKCGIEKCESEFNKEPLNKSGISSWCKKCKNERSRIWRLLNSQKDKQRKREYYAENTEAVREASREWYENNTEQGRKSRHAWFVANPDKKIEHGHNRRARLLGNGGKITSKEWEDMKAFYNYTCLCCGKREPEIKLTLDHVKPLAIGGKNVIENAQPLCKPCNSKKHKKHIDYRRSK